MSNLEVEKVVLDSPQVHDHPLREPALPDGRHWKIKLSIAMGAASYTAHTIVAHPARMVNGVDELALTTLRMLNRILAVPDFRTQFMGKLPRPSETIDLNQHLF